MHVAVMALFSLIHSVKSHSNVPQCNRISCHWVQFNISPELLLLTVTWYNTSGWMSAILRVFRYLFSLRPQTHGHTHGMSHILNLDQLRLCQSPTQYGQDPGRFSRSARFEKSRMHADPVSRFHRWSRGDDWGFRWELVPEPTGCAAHLQGWCQPPGHCVPVETVSLKPSFLHAYICIHTHILCVYIYVCLCVCNVKNIKMLTQNKLFLLTTTIGML